MINFSTLRLASSTEEFRVALSLTPFSKRLSASSRSSSPPSSSSTSFSSCSSDSSNLGASAISGSNLVDRGAQASLTQPHLYLISWFQLFRRADQVARSVKAGRVAPRQDRQGAQGLEASRARTQGFTLGNDQPAHGSDDPDPQFVQALGMGFKDTPGMAALQ